MYSVLYIDILGDKVRLVLRRKRIIPVGISFANSSVPAMDKKFRFLILGYFFSKSDGIILIIKNF